MWLQWRVGIRPDVSSTRTVSNWLLLNPSGWTAFHVVPTTKLAVFSYFVFIHRIPSREFSLNLSDCFCTFCKAHIQTKGMCKNGKLYTVLITFLVRIN